MKILKYISAFLLIALLLAAFPSCGALFGEDGYKLPTRKLVSEDSATSGDYMYRLYDDGTAQITDYKGNATVIEIPDTIEGRRVVSIDSYAFVRKNVVSVTLNPSLEELCEGAFYECGSLSGVKFGNKLTSVGVFAFDGTPWFSARTEDFCIVGDGVLYAYQGSATAVVVPDSVKHIGPAFLTNETVISVEMGDSVLTVGTAAFSGCSNLRRVMIGKNVVSIGEGAFASCEALTSVVIPDKVEIIGPHAFDFCTFMTSAKLGASVRTIGEYAFYNCNRMSVIDIPESIENIANYAFYDCFSLVVVNYGGSREQFEALEFDSASNYTFSGAIKQFAK